MARQVDQKILVNTEFRSGEKPGVKTTEFYIALVFGATGPILLILKALGILDQSVDTDQAESTIQQIGEQVIILIALLTGGGVSLGYISARKAVKTESAKAVGMAAMMNSNPDRSED